MQNDYDVVVIGAGPGGHAMAEETARLGARAAIIEKDKWGGTCTHLGCIPTKALLACSRRYAEIGKLKRLGVSVSGAGFDFPAMKRHQGQIVRVSALGVQKSLDDAGVVRLEGEGRIVSPSEVEVLSPKKETVRLKTKNVVIAWGSEPALLPGIVLSGRILNSDGFLALEKLPASVVIVGGGAIGIEFGNLLAELGVKVSLVELLDQILPYEDKEAADFLARELSKTGVDIHTSTRLVSLEETADGVRLQGLKGDEAIGLDGECALVCTGRKPFLKTEELDRLGIAYSRKGIAVDGRQQTNVRSIFALGDATGGMLLAHRAGAQGRSLAHFLFGDGTFFYREDTIPSVVYTHPNLSRIGLTEQQARDQGLAFEIRRVEYGSNIIARTELKGNGFMKVVLSHGKLLGATIVGDEAAELIASLSLAVAKGLGVPDLRQWVLPHPSLSELLKF